MRRYSFYILFLLGLAISAFATEPPTFSEEHGYKNEAFTLKISSSTSGSSIYYTLDCTTPSAKNGTLYTGPLRIEKTSVLRAVAVDAHGEESETTAATYIFIDDVLKQGNNPAGYPSEWGPYSSISGTAKADYEMDPEMTSDDITADSIRRALLSLPVISIVTEPGFLFSHEKDDERGGIYIYTGGDAKSTANGYGIDWLRAASVEFWEGDGDYGGFSHSDNFNVLENTVNGFQVNCAIKIHGNASRQAEKTPKHSFRMKMKGSYGPKKLKYELFGEGGGKKFNQIVIRAGFGNSWVHWENSQQKRAMYTRDAWAKRMMAKMGHLSVGTRYAHLYLNGMYWGLYNPTERIDAEFCELHLGGTAEEYDVVRCDDGSINCVDGTLDDYKRLLKGVENSSDYAVYQGLRGLDVSGNPLNTGDVLFDADNFIDYMLLNYYCANTDWDHHNWAAVHRHGAKEGFRWLPWDSEGILQKVDDNVLNVKNKNCPTYIFKKLMENSVAFRMNFTDRAYRALCETFGVLRPESTQAVWEQLTDEIEESMWAESARWGDYRRDVHRYTTQGDLYTKHSYFDPQCKYMRNTYFPRRTSVLRQQLQDAGYWTTVKEVPSLSIGYDDLLDYSTTVESSQFLSLRGGSVIYYTIDGSDPMKFTSEGKATQSTTAKLYDKAFQISENCILKARVCKSSTEWGPLLERQLTVRDIDGIVPVSVTPTDGHYYDLTGRRVMNPKPGIYIRNGRKVIVK